VDTRTGTIVVAHPDDASVSLVEAASGRGLRTVPVGLPPLALAVDQRRGRIVVLTTASLSASGRVDQVQVLEGRTGRLLRTVAVGTDASAVALDECTGQVFATAINVNAMPAGSDTTGPLRVWLGRWLPRRWVPQLLPPAPVTTTGTVSMLDLSRL
jgi:hypothetical protein